MAWPPTLPTIPLEGGVGAQGDATTFCWGTEDLFGVFVVTKASQKELVENLKFANGSGVDNARVQLKHGNEWIITVRDDNTQPALKVGQTANVIDMIGVLGTKGLSYSGRITDGNYEAAPKQPGERNITVERLTLAD